MGEKRPHPDSAKVDIAKKVAEAKARAAAAAARSKQNVANERPTPLAHTPQIHTSPPPSSIPPRTTSAPSQSQNANSAQEKIAEVKARIEAMKAEKAATSAAPQNDLQAKIVAAKARAAAAAAAAANKIPQNGTMQATSPPPPATTAPEPRGGLKIGLHPMLMGDMGADGRTKGKDAMGPKFATTIANRRTESPMQKDQKQLDLSPPSVEELKKNPYFDASLGTPAVARPHKRALVFNQPGKYVAQASEQRQKQRLEELNKQLAEEARKKALEEADNEKAFLVQPPPEIEWWDEVFINGRDYENLDAPGKLKIDSPDEKSVEMIIGLVQHPVPIEPPQDKLAPELKPQYLTKHEQAKLRRQRRMAEHKEQQAKIRLGLEPPPPPKVKKGNLMRVLGEQAVKDPTAVEAEVNRQIAERRMKHEQMNEERKLTKEERHEKLAKQQEMDAAKGIYVCVFRVDNLSFGKHRYQVDVFAKEYSLTGTVILHPKMNLIIVEGGEYSVKKYKKTMLNRVKWTENAMPNSVREGNREVEAGWLQSVDENGNLKDLSQNRCILVWEGMERQRSFRKWGTRVCETDAEAKDALSRAKMENMWTLAKSIE